MARVGPLRHRKKKQKIYTVENNATAMPLINFNSQWYV